MDDPGIEHATERVVDTWNEATPGKNPDASAEDFARMREGVAAVTEGEVDPTTPDASKPDGDPAA